MQLPAVQPTPTRCPTVSPLAARPTSTTRPTASCPSTAENCENPPVVVPDRNVGVTQSTVLDLHFHFLVPKRLELDLLPNQAALRGRGDPCFDRCHCDSPTR